MGGVCNPDSLMGVSLVGMGVSLVGGVCNPDSLMGVSLVGGVCNPDSSVGGNSDSRFLRLLTETIVRSRAIHCPFLNPANPINPVNPASDNF